MRQYTPYPEISGAIQKNRIYLSACRENILLKFDDSLRKKTVDSLAQFQTNPSHPLSQWFMGKIIHLSTGFASRSFYSKAKPQDLISDSWSFKGSAWNHYGRQWGLLFDPIPFYTWFRYELNSHTFPETDLATLLLRDPKEFMQMAKFVFAQSKYLAKQVERILDQEILSPALEYQLVEMQAYYLTVADSVAALELGKYWEQLILPQTIELGDLLRKNIQSKNLLAYFLVGIVERLIYLDDHPIKVLLKKMLSIQLFQKDYLVVDLSSENAPLSIYSEVEAMGLISLTAGSKLINSCHKYLDVFYHNQSMFLAKLESVAGL